MIFSAPLVAVNVSVVFPDSRGVRVSGEVKEPVKILFVLDEKDDKRIFAELSIWIFQSFVSRRFSNSSRSVNKNFDGVSLMRSGSSDAVI